MFISYCIECYIYVNQESPINVYTWVILDKNIVNK